MSEVPFKQHIDVEAPKASGIDAATAAILANKGGDGMFGGNGIMGLLALGLLGGGGLGFGRGREGVDALAITNTTGNPDVLAAVNRTDQNITAQLGNTSREILSGQTNGFRDLVDQTHGVESNITTAVTGLAMQSARETAALQAAASDTNAATQLGLCNTQHEIQTTSAATQLQALQNKFELSSQLAQCCCENKLATANLLTQMSLQHCELQKDIAADGQATRALITANRMDDLQAQLNDAKSAFRDQAIINAIFGTPVLPAGVTKKAS